MLPHFYTVQQFGKYVHHHCLHGAIGDCNDPIAYGFVDEMETQVDMFRPGMELAIL